MDAIPAIVSQYRAALTMLRNAVEACPQEQWDSEAYTNRFWQVAYHTLFYTDLYLCEAEAAFVPWEKHLKDYESLGPIPWDNNRMPAIGEPYTKVDVVDYLGQCEGFVKDRIDRTDLDVESGFCWLPFGKLELQFYNIRHVQHHAAQLIERLRENAGIAIGWTGAGRE